MTTRSPRNATRAGARYTYAIHSATMVSAKAISHNAHDRRLSAAAYVTTATSAAIATAVNPSRARFTRLSSWLRERQRRSRDSLKRVQIAPAGRFDHLGGQRR